MFIVIKLWWVWSMLWCCVQARNTSRPATTAPAEAQALNSAFQQWGTPADTNVWNTTGDPCSGVAIDDTVDINNQQYNPFIKCDCSYDGNTTCHITALKVYQMDAIGVIPDGFWNLVYLNNLILEMNFLTGPIAAGIGNLTNLQYLDLGTNAFNGPLPKELGKLTELLSLGIGTNNFSGLLPPEIGNLRKLQKLYIDSSGVGGPIPPSFANLHNLQILWAPDVELTGSIPEFIGNWSQLQTLVLEGNSLVGPIPSALSSLTSLTELRITGLLNSSSTLDFVTNLQSLKTLVLRSSNIIGSIPSSIEQLQSLTQLDLGFNNLTGQIPSSLFNLGSLSYLSLGNNKLRGSLPAQKSTSLVSIDLSYNQLSGNFPSWVSGQNLQLNFVANNFSVMGSNSRALPSGLNCMQNGFPCNTGLGRYSDFAINCGGPQISATNQVVYESDTKSLGPASYFVTNSDEWAVSNVGFFTSDGNVSTIFNSPVTFTSIDSQLYQTARQSARSLHYYGLGLQNGNYNVLLQFAEIRIQNGRTWKSLQRRIFDILIQGNRMEKDFNIRKQAGDQSYRPVQRNYTVEVKANVLDMHLLWAGKGTNQGAYGPLISAISITPLFQPKPISSANSKRTAMICGIVVPVVIIALLLLTAYWFIERKKKAYAARVELLGMDAKPYTFSYSELRSATGDFSSSNKLGEGGFGPVYKGTLSDGRLIAVKQLSVASPQGKDQFIAEIATISAVQHRNLVKLHGCCIDGKKRLLVYEYLENKSLDKALFKENDLKLNWAQRFEICLGVARGLAYLHQESRIRIVHRDVKASNILLDSELNSKISDFGLAKLYDETKTHITTNVAGTIGYVAPEYAICGHLTEKVDVFGFGFVALEIVSGRSNYDRSFEKEQTCLLEWAWHLHENGQYVELVDKRLSEFNEDEVKRMIGVALLCTQTAPSLRPTMSRALAMLTGDIEVITASSKPTYLGGWSSDDSILVLNDDSQASRRSYTNSNTMTSFTPNSPLWISTPSISDETEIY